MKTIITSILFTTLLTCNICGQVPQAFSYQSVIRDGWGELVTNQQVGIQISILQGSSSGTAVYTETHSPTTNANGLASIAIGTGSVITGVFQDIDWANGPYFVRTETDPAGGTSYAISSISQLLSSPYALLAENVSNTPIAEVFVDSQSRTIDPPNSNWINGPIFPTINGFRSGSRIRIDYSVPSRTEISTFSGLYIEPQISFDNGSTWQSLGSCGWDGSIMTNGAGMIGTYSNSLLIDPEINNPFSVKVKLMYKSYYQGGNTGVPIRINGSHDINNISGTAPLMGGVNGTQHFTKVIITELFDTE